MFDATSFTHLQCEANRVCRKLMFCHLVTERRHLFAGVLPLTCLTPRRSRTTSSCMCVVFSSWTTVMSSSQSTWGLSRALWTVKTCPSTSLVRCCSKTRSSRYHESWLSDNLCADMQSQSQSYCILLCCVYQTFHGRVAKVMMFDCLFCLVPCPAVCSIAILLFCMFQHFCFIPPRIRRRDTLRGLHYMLPILNPRRSKESTRPNPSLFHSLPICCFRQYRVCSSHAVLLLIGCLGL